MEKHLRDFQRIIKPNNDNAIYTYRSFHQRNEFCPCPLIRSSYEPMVSIIVYCKKFYKTYNKQNGSFKIEYLLLLICFQAPQHSDESEYLYENVSHLVIIIITIILSILLFLSISG